MRAFSLVMLPCITMVKRGKFYTHKSKVGENSQSECKWLVIFPPCKLPILTGYTTRNVRFGLRNLQEPGGREAEFLIADGRSGTDQAAEKTVNRASSSRLAGDRFSSQ